MTFSVTIPAYKSQFLSKAIESVIAQTCQDWELVIVDDCSPENLHAIVEPFLKDSRIRYYRNEQNCGAVNVVDNWNICLSHSIGDYIICMGDDDCLVSNCLEQYKTLIEQYPTLNVYHTRTEIINEKGELTTLQEPRPEWESALSMLWNRWDHRDYQFIGDFCYRTQYLKSVGGYYKLPLAWGSDDITAILAAKEKGIANTKNIGFQYRENKHTISSSFANKRLKIEACLMQYHWFTAFLENLSPSQLTDLDRKYLQTIDNCKNEHFLVTFTKDCTEYIAGNPKRLLWCYRQLQPLCYGKGIFLKWFLKSI